MVERHSMTWSGLLIAFVGLAWLGCSGAESTKLDAGTNLLPTDSGEDRPVAKDLLSERPATGDTANDGPNLVCPGHVGLPASLDLTIRTSDGAPTIAALALDWRVCQGYRTDYFFDASAGGRYSELVLHRGGPYFVEGRTPEESEPAPCVFEVVSIYGARVKVTGTLSYRHRTVQHCDTNSDCCEPHRTEWLGTMEFNPKIQTVTFPPAPDASADVPFIDAAQDGPSTTDAAVD